VTILVCEHGLIKIRGRRFFKFAWSDVAYFEGTTAFEGELLGKIRREDGSSVSFEKHVPGCRRKLNDLARRQVWQCRFPTDLAKYERGEFVEYGQLGVSKEGLFANGHLLTWSEIARLRIESGDLLTVRRRGSFFHWFSKRTRKIPNFYILRHFIELHAAIEHES
jgi:hypothetical protein